MESWKKRFLGKRYIFLLVSLIFLFFYPFVLFGKIPIPADTIVGMYHPWRDVVWDNLTTGVPFKNHLITDPVRQQYIWRALAIEQLKQGNLPVWNPYSFSGAPLLANFQSAPFYPFNLLFFILPFNLAWGILVMLQPLLAGIFLYSYLRFIKISQLGSFFGAFAFVFSGFTIAWLEWNTVVHTVLWLPLILLSTEKVILCFNKGLRSQGENKKLFFWSAIFVFSLISSFFAGHLQVFFYSFSLINIYLIIKIILLKQNRIKLTFLFSILYFLFFIITAIQWLPAFQFILLSARGFDQSNWLKSGWFIPWQNLIQFIAPDFFGNPATLNYWGVWNYAEFVGYIGIVPLFFALYALFFRCDRKNVFFGSLVFLGLIFSLPTPLAKLLFVWQIPFISSSQPTRLIFIVDFALCVLAALGFDQLIKDKNGKKVLIILLAVGLIFSLAWIFIFNQTIFNFSLPHENLLVSRKNLILPTLMFLVISVFLYFFTTKFKFSGLALTVIIIIMIFDLLRFGWKFTPFSPSHFIFPDTKLINILKEKIGFWRFMSLDRRVMPSNFAAYYHLQDVSGYDPLYLALYGQLVAAWERGKADIAPASFNRIITPTNFESFITDLLGVKYVLSYEPVHSEKLALVALEGKTFLYENKRVFPRAFLVENVIRVDNLNEEIERMFNLSTNLRTVAVSGEDVSLVPKALTLEDSVRFIEYSENHINLEVKTAVDRLLILTDIYYPSWQAFINGNKTKLLRVNFAFRGVIVPKGKQQVEFKANLL